MTGRMCGGSAGIRSIFGPRRRIIARARPRPRFRPAVAGQSGNMAHTPGGRGGGADEAAVLHINMLALLGVAGCVIPSMGQGKWMTSAICGALALLCAHGP